MCMYLPCTTHRVHRNDLLSAVSYALRSEVPIHSIVSGSAYSSLLRFINLLEKVVYNSSQHKYIRMHLYHIGFRSLTYM